MIAKITSPLLNFRSLCLYGVGRNLRVMHCSVLQFVSHDGTFSVSEPARALWLFASSDIVACSFFFQIGAKINKFFLGCPRLGKPRHVVWPGTRSFVLPAETGAPRSCRACRALGRAGPPSPRCWIVLREKFGPPVGEVRPTVFSSAI